MKHLILILFPLVTSIFAVEATSFSTKSLLPLQLYQDNHNQVSISTYENIKINGVFLGELQSFKGEVAAMEDLLRISLSVKIPDPEVRTFYNSSIQLAYGDATANWILYSIEILKADIALEILGKNVRLGDDISILGLGSELKSLPVDGGNRSAVFTTEYDDSYVAIHFDPQTKKITKIYYLSPT